MRSMHVLIFFAIVLISITVMGPATTESQMNIDYSALADEIFSGLNNLRQNPKSYIPDLESLFGKFSGNTLIIENIHITTREGVMVVKETIGFLEKCQPMQKLIRSSELDAAAKEHQADQSSSGGLGHKGSDGSSPSQRIRKYLKGITKTGECISYNCYSCGKSVTGKDMVLQLVVDDGIMNRAHRTSVTNPQFKKTGIACGPHPKYEFSCVITFSD